MIECYKYNNFVEDKTNPAWDLCIKYMEIYNPKDNENQKEYDEEAFLLYFGQGCIKKVKDQIGYYRDDNLFIPIGNPDYEYHKLNIFIMEDSNEIVEILIKLCNSTDSGYRFRCYTINIQGKSTIKTYYNDEINICYKKYTISDKQKLSLFLWTLSIKTEFIRNKDIEKAYNKYLYNI